MHNDCEISAGSCSLSSWLLVNEPRPQVHSAQMPWTTMRNAVELGTLAGISLGAASLRKLLEERGCDCDGL
jgi:hypothetical protein